MFDVLVYVYEHFWRGQSSLELSSLERKLAAAGFESGEIEQALVWLDGLYSASQLTRVSAAANSRPAVSPDYIPSLGSLRVYSELEQAFIGTEGLSFLMFLDSTGVMPAQVREIIIDRALAVGHEPISLEDLKIIILMVFWSAGIEPDILVLDELCDDPHHRVAH